MSAVALQHQHLFLQRQAALQDSANLASNVNDINAAAAVQAVSQDSSLIMSQASALNDIENAIRHQQEMARIVATAKIFANASARTNSRGRRDSFSLRHSLTGGVLQGDSNIDPGGHTLDDESFNAYETNEEEKPRRRSSSSTTAAVAHAHHLHSVGQNSNNSTTTQSILRQSGNSNKSLSSSTVKTANVSSSSINGSHSHSHSHPVDQTKINVALDIFRAENASLMKRCLLLAGFEGPQTEECTLTYLEFLTNVIKVEEQRLSHLCTFFNSINSTVKFKPNRVRSSSINSTNSSESDVHANDLPPTPPPSLHHETRKHIARRSASASIPSSRRKNNGGTHRQRRRTSFNIRRDFMDQVDDDHDSPPSHHNNNNNPNPHSAHQCPIAPPSNTSSFTPRKKDTMRRFPCFEGRHVHRLSGKCGHKPLLHKPDGAPAHVDFLVNGKVECYQNVKPYIPSSKKTSALWPSGFKNEELNDGNDDSIQCEENTCGEECKGQQEPKILDDIDFNGKEWNENFIPLNLPEGKEDDVLMGLLGMCNE